MVFPEKEEGGGDVAEDGVEGAEGDVEEEEKLKSKQQMWQEMQFLQQQQQHRQLAAQKQTIRRQTRLLLPVVLGKMEGLARLGQVEVEAVEGAGGDVAVDKVDLGMV